MKFTFAILLALFAVLCICQAYPQPAPEEATAQANGEETKAEATAETKSDEQILAELKASPNGRFWWTVIRIGAQLIGSWIANRN